MFPMMDFSVIFGEEEAAILAYCNDDEPKSAEKTRFGRVRLVLIRLKVWLVLNCETQTYTRTESFSHKMKTPDM